MGYLRSWMYIWRNLGFKRFWNYSWLDKRYVDDNGKVVRCIWFCDRRPYAFAMPYWLDKIVIGVFKLVLPDNFHYVNKEEADRFLGR